MKNTGGKGEMELGQMRYCLKEVRNGNNHPAISSLKEFLDTLADSTWLTSEKTETLLQTLSTKYRNGGVHEHMVSFEVCQEALDRFLFGKDPMVNNLLVASTPR